MDTLTLLLVVHVLGGVLGVGGATFIEIIFNKSIRDGVMDPTELGFMRMTATVLRTGLLISVFSGLALMLWFRFDGQVFRLYDPVLWAKFTILFVLMINGVLLQLHKVPIAVGSAISFVSWYSVFIFGLLASGPSHPYVALMLWYGAALVVGGCVLEGIRRMLGIRLKL